MKYSALDLGLELMDLLERFNNYDEDCDYDHDFTNDDLYELPF